MQNEKIFLAGRNANFYLISAAAQETRFLVEPKSEKEKVYLEQMNGALNLMEQHRKLQQHKAKKFIPRVVEFDAETGRLIITISASLTAATSIKTLMAERDCFTPIDCIHEDWITEQAFRLASSAYEAGVILPFSAENFLICSESESFILLDWTMAQVNSDKERPIDAEIAKAQVVDLAKMLSEIVDYRGLVSVRRFLDRRLPWFIEETMRREFPSATEAMRTLRDVLS